MADNSSKARYFPQVTICNGDKTITLQSFNKEGDVIAEGKPANVKDGIAIAMTSDYTEEDLTTAKGGKFIIGKDLNFIRIDGATYRDDLFLTITSKSSTKDS